MTSEVEPLEAAVQVVVQVRPLLAAEGAQGARPVVHVGDNATSVTVDRAASSGIGAGEPLVFHGFDACFDGDVDALVQQHVSALTQSVFDGVNSTAFAYGQTAAGKSYTMERLVEAVADAVCAKRDALVERGSVVTLRVGYVELYNERIRDLCCPLALGADRIRIEVRERRGRTPGAPRSVFLDGAKERVVNSPDELKSIIHQGGLLRQTAATGMNARSSRSHSIITLSVQSEAVDDDGDGDANGKSRAKTLAAKLHLVDLAGSERAKRTDAKGARFKEGIQINRSLFALAKVISALSDNARCGNKRAPKHVPYRDSKLTRLLQDSLGGTARTLLVACISPADCNADETLGTLRYATRAKAIKNTLRVNVDPHAAEVADLRAALARARATVAALAAENDELRKKVAPGAPSQRRTKSSKHLPGAGPSSPRRKPRPRSDILANGAEQLLLPPNGTLPPDATNANHAAAAANAAPPSRLRRKRHRNVETSTSPPPGDRITPAPGPSSSCDVEELDEESAHDAEVERALMVARTDEMRRSFEARVADLERDKKMLEADKVELQRKLTAVDEARKARAPPRADRPWQLAPPTPAVGGGSGSSKRDSMLSQMTRLRRERDAALKSKGDCERKLAESRAVREELLRKVGTAMAKVDSVRIELSRDNRALLKNTSHLKVQLERANVLRNRQEAAVLRLQVENDVLRKKLRDVNANAARDDIARRAAVQT